ncbi:MAG: hemerythrin domain-containing protein [Polyangiaceae bacterium]|nr:hemerythrin domain-containing protein [Polyangiaceae bacterium]MCB9608457.1 hemerythrin domain-containing protein [Polyangiaceae bacterium]
MSEEPVSESQRFRRQHRELMRLAGELLSYCEPTRVREQAAEVRTALVRFTGKLRIHAAMENDAVYPRLMNHSREDVRKKAQSLFAEVGDLYKRFDRYSKQWHDLERLKSEPHRFLEETQEMLRALGMRMMREDAELYPLVDEVG